MRNKQGGIIKLIILIVIGLAVLSYFGFNLRGLVESEAFQSNWNFFWGKVAYVWNTYLAAPAHYLWDLFVNLVWHPIIEGLQRLQGGSNPLIVPTNTALK
jgi:hypothetical protein